MKTYKFQVKTERGIVNIDCTSAAKTGCGVYRAMGKAVAKKIGTDVFECREKAVWREGVARDYSLSSWRSMTINKLADRLIWEAAHDALMG